jgi:hypothetical protein
MTPGEVAAFLAAVLAALVIAEDHPDYPDAVALARRIDDDPDAEVRWAIGRLGFLIADSAGPPPAVPVWVISPSGRHGWRVQYPDPATGKGRRRTIPAELARTKSGRERFRAQLQRELAG